jgi:hypothetical protein
VWCTAIRVCVAEAANKGWTGEGGNGRGLRKVDWIMQLRKWACADVAVLPASETGLGAFRDRPARAGDPKAWSPPTGRADASRPACVFMTAD